MFKFLFRGKALPEPVKETQRETMTRALDELNGIIALMDPKPKITLDTSNGRLEVHLPEQMPDEALALPAPAAQEPAAKVAKPAADAAPSTSGASGKPSATSNGPAKADALASAKPETPAPAGAQPKPA